MKKLNLGCGRTLREEFTNIDIVDFGGNIVHDLNNTPYPFEDNTFDYILASHVLEHLNSFHKTVTELARILKPGGILEVYAPFFLNTKYFGEPDHKIPFSIRTFDNYEFLENRKLRFYERWKLEDRTDYSGRAKYEVLEKKFNVSNFGVLRWMNFFVNLEPVVYERFFAGLFSPEEVYFKLKNIK